MASLFHWQWLVKYQHIYDGKMSLSKMPIIFVEIVYYFFRKCDFFWREIFPPYFLQWHKCLSLVRYYLWRLNKKPLELLTLVTALVHRKYKIYIFYGVSICDKQSSIVNIKERIIYDDRRNTVRNTVDTINTCDGFCALKIQNIYFL